MIFGTYFKESEPVYSEIKVKVFDHDKSTLKDLTNEYQ
jgi:hypothetical protein